MRYPALPLMILLLVLCLITGCSSPSSKPPATVAKEGEKSKSWRVGLDLVRQAPDAARCREGLDLLNPKLTQNAEKSKLALPAETRKFLQAAANLTADELNEVESPTFRPADAHYVIECLLLRDAARSLEISGLAPAELADRCFGWVQRQVLLYEQGEEGLPPVYVLRRGYGSARDRALVFVALLRQLQLQACVFVSRASPGEVVLAGVLCAPDEVRLFDPRLGLAVRTSDGRVAMLKDVKADPKLLQGSDLTPEQFQAAEVRLYCPLQALPIRMSELEKALAVQDRVVLYLEPVKLRREMEQATGLAVHVWNGNGDKSATRALRLFLPPEEGGTDKERRLQHFQEDLTPTSSVILALEQINLGPGRMPPQALAYMLMLTDDLFKKYEQQPHEMVVRGKSEEAIQRFERARSFLEDDNLGGLADDPSFQKAVAEWRERLSAGYAALAAKDPRGQAQVNNAWGEDMFLGALLAIDAEERPDKFPKKTPVRVIAHAAREHLVARVLWLRALLWQEKAQRSQLLALRAAKGNKTAATSARNDWHNTRVAWNLFLDRAAIGPAVRRQRADVIRGLLKRPDELSPLHAAHMLEVLHLELHRYIAARMNLAQALFNLDGASVADPALRELEEELTALLEKDANDPLGLKADLDLALKQLRPQFAPVSRSLALVGRDWAPRGNIYWLRQQVRRQVELWEEAKGS
jgi:hypothetical protein